MKNPTLSRILLICSLCITLTTARAQYVSIPDTTFAKFLNYYYSSCMTGNSTSGWRLDTTCPGVLSAKYMISNGNAFINLTGLQYFKNLDTFYCSNSTNLTTVPALPDSLIYLMINNCHLTSLPPLPARLTYLDCSINYITALPALPANLNTLVCTQNQLSNLPTLPASLRTLQCGSNHMASLPALPVALQYLQCYGNSLSSLPALGDSLIGLTCYYNGLTSLPAFPSTLHFVDCSENPVTGLPALPDSFKSLTCTQCHVRSLPSLPQGMSTLVCDWDSLTGLPSLPASLTYLNCSYNKISVLPSLPESLTSLLCSSNPISCLPRIYQNHLNYFYIDGTNIQCLPNRFTFQYGYAASSMPLCDPASGCDFYYNIAGNIHNDTSLICLSDSLYPGLPVTNMKIQLKQSGQVIQQYYTSSSGSYSFNTGGLGNYDVDIDTAGLPIQVACPSVGQRSVTLSAADSVLYDQNFGMTCSTVDFGILYITSDHFRPGDTSAVQINAGNIALLRYNTDCGAGTSGTVTTSYSGPLHYVGPAPGALTPTSVSGDTLNYSIADLNTIHNGSFDILLVTDTLVSFNSTACITATINPSVSDADQADNTLTYCTLVGNSHDPNHKDVYPLDTVQPGQWLTYRVQFQNTGNDTAHLVVVKDTLSQYVDASSFQYLASSAKVVIQLFGNAMVFTFPHINLLDSLHHVSQSTGWIQYRVKAKTNLSEGSQIKNTASIYFDLNTAVVTNTTINIVDTAVTRTACADTTITLSHAICQGDTFVFGSMHLSAPGTFRDTLTRAGGCDSIFVLNLTVHTLPVVTLNFDTLAQERYLAHSGSYYWWCPLFFPRDIIPLTGGLPVGGTYSGSLVQNDTLNFTNFHFSSPIDTVFYTFTDSNHCSASAADSIIFTSCDGVQDIGINPIHLYPNPNKGTFTLQTSNSINNEYTISDMLGNVIMQKNITSNDQFIDLPEAGEGVYIVVVKGSSPVRFVIMR